MIQIDLFRSTLAQRPAIGGENAERIVPCVCVDCSL